MIRQFLKFTPIFKEKIWGGNKLKEIFHKQTNQTHIGESWEISDVDGNLSVVENGALKGKKLRELIKTHTSELLGNKVFNQFGIEFPLLIKFIDAQEKLSIQLHPNDDLSRKRHNSFGKTEMWYVMNADEDATIIVGFKEDSNQQEYLYHLKNKSLLHILNVDTVKKGDVYFIPTGRIHAIGAGVLLAEIQQTSDNTYRIFDWDRKDFNGHFRELHTDLAIAAIDYSSEKNYKTTYKKQNNESSEILSCPYFTTHIISLTDLIKINHLDKDSFVIYMCVDGEVEFIYQDIKERLHIGQTLLVPACIKEFEISAKIPSELLEVFIQ